MHPSLEEIVSLPTSGYDDDCQNWDYKMFKARKLTMTT